MMRFKVNDQDCKHDQGFAFGGNAEEGKEGWFCYCGCGFYLNFNPEKYPFGIALIKKQGLISL